MKITEEWLGFLWEEIIPQRSDLKTTDNHPVRILSPGFRNSGKGPDYFNARLEIDGILWAGNVELHVRSSDWKQHHHDYDPSYTRLILHVVWEHDVSGQQATYDPPLLELKTFFSSALEKSWESWIKKEVCGQIPCQEYHTCLPPLKVREWLERMSVARLEERIIRMEEKFYFFNSDWNQLLYSVMLEAFGFHVNAVPCFQLSVRLPLRIILKESGSVVRTDALLLGTSGLIYELIPGKYRQQLLQEYEFLRSKYGLEPMEDHVWKSSGVRPANHPVIRLMQFSRMLCTYQKRFNGFQPHIPAADLLTFVRSMFVREDFNHPEIPLSIPGKQTRQLLILNGWTLFYFFYGKKTGHHEYCTLAVEMMQSLPPEKNYKTRLFSKIPLETSSAFITQGMIHLFNTYCRMKKCLQCAWGKQCMKEKII